MRRKMNQRERLLAVTVGVLLVVYLMNRLAIAPLRSDWTQTGVAWERAQMEYAAAVKTARLAAQAQMPQTAAASAGDNAGLADFLREIEAAAGPRIVIRRFQPMEARIESRRAATMRRHTVQIECTGPLVELMAFVEKIEQQNQFTRVRQFYLSPDRAQNQLQCRMVLVRLVLI